MSKYENYDKISRIYDLTRTAVGIELILGILYKQKKNMSELVVLDAGCGTGNYSEILKEHVGTLICTDLSYGMLNRAIKKVETDSVSTNLVVQADLSEFPFQENSFDHIICNQCIHHLDEPGNGFKNLRTFFSKAHKALKPNGSIIVNTITHRQMRDGVWWAELIKPAIEKMSHRFSSDSEFKSIVDDSGFIIEQRLVPAHEIIQLKGYFNYQSLRDVNFRSGDSHFSLLTDEELKEMLAQLDDLEETGRIAEYLKARDELREQVGQFTVFNLKKKNG